MTKSIEFSFTDLHILLEALYDDYYRLTNDDIDSSDITFSKESCVALINKIVDLYKPEV